MVSVQVEIFSISYVYLISAMVGESIRFIPFWTEYLWLAKFCKSAAATALSNARPDVESDNVNRSCEKNVY